MKAPPLLRSARLLGFAAVGIFCHPGVRASSLTIANPSFELPALTDGNAAASPSFASQGGYGWTLPTIYNPASNTYATAAGQGTPTGADGAQVASVYQAGGNATQTLAGFDGILGNADDPGLTAQTTYTLTIAVGHRLPGNPSGVSAFGTLDISLVAGSTTIAEDSNVLDPGEGVFSDRTISVNSALLDPALYGQALTIRITQTQVGNFVSDFDNVRLDAITVPEPGAGLLGLCGGGGLWLLAHRRRLKIG